MFESLKKTVRGNSRVATTEEMTEALAGYPVIENVSGLPVGTTITEIREVAVVIPEIRGQKRNPAVVMECIVDGKKDPRPIYLSSLIRKKDIEDDFKGLIADDANFKDYSSFTNKDWVDAFKKAVPFHVEKSEPFERMVNASTGEGQQKITGKVLTLKKGKA